MQRDSREQSLLTWGICSKDRGPTEASRLVSTWKKCFGDTGDTTVAWTKFCHRLQAAVHVKSIFHTGEPFKDFVLILKKANKTFKIRARTKFLCLKHNVGSETFSNVSEFPLGGGEGTRSDPVGATEAKWVFP